MESAFIPDRAYLELKVRLYNRTPLTQTFLVVGKCRHARA